MEARAEGGSVADCGSAMGACEIAGETPADNPPQELRNKHPFWDTGGIAYLGGGRLGGGLGGGEGGGGLGGGLQVQDGIGNSR